MDAYQSFFVTAALSLPAVTLIALGRAALCVIRSIQAKHLKFTIFSILGIVIMLVIFAAVFVVWFAYGVGHTGKDMSSDLVLLASTGTLIYVAVFCLWWWCLKMEKRLVKKDAW